MVPPNGFVLPAAMLSSQFSDTLAVDPSVAVNHNPNYDYG
jgi:hypothetical protein